MSGKARFPGKSQNKNTGKHRLSYKDIGGAPANDGYNAIVAATATNLKAFRTFFKSDDEDDVEFLGFEVQDPLVAKCKNACILLRKEANALNNVPSNGEQVKDISSPRLNSTINLSSHKTTLPLSTDLNTTTQSSSNSNNTVSISSPDEEPTTSNVSKAKSKSNSNILSTLPEKKLKKPPANIAVTKLPKIISPQVGKLNGTSANNSHDTNSKSKPIVNTSDSNNFPKSDANSSVLILETSTRSSRIIRPNKKFMDDETVSEKPVSRKRPRSSETSHKSTTSGKADNKDSHHPKIVSQPQHLGNGVVTSTPIKQSKTSSISAVSGNANPAPRGGIPAKLSVSSNLNTSVVPVPKPTIGNFKDEALKETVIDKEQEKLYANRPELVGACVVPFDAKQTKTANGTVQNMEGIIVCGACRKIRHLKIPATNNKWGIFLCDLCYVLFAKLMSDFDTLQFLFCSTDEGRCLSEPEKIVRCRACFAKFCLLSMDLPEATYLQLWRCLPDTLRPSVAPKASNDFSQYPNRGKIVYVSKTGSIISASPLPLKSLRRVAPWDKGVRTSTSSVKSLSFSDLKVEVPVSPVDKQVKRLLPNDDLNFKRVKGARVKQASHRSGIPHKLPVATFKDLSTLPSTSAGFLKSGKFSFLTEQENNSSRDLGADEEILFGRQKGPVRERIKTLVPFDMESVEEHGFPVVVTGSFPPKPLCFLCGSAGIQQLIFCTQCCEPYHPFCAGDDTLMSYAIKTITTRNCQVVPIQKQGVDSHPRSSTERKDNNNGSLLNSASSLLSPPLTPLHFLPEEQSAENEDGYSSEDSDLDEEMKQHVLAWTCQRCIICKSCGLNTKEQPNGTKEKEFIKCVQCRDPYHLACVNKKVATTVKKEGHVNWSCAECCKCRSCGKNLEGNRQSQNVEVSVEDGGDVSWTGRKSNNLLLCMECFRKRQDGSFCPVCQVCYDENDYETKMMECSKCERWIHATCESISNEQYQILGTLPECIEYICKVCDKGNSVWRRALEMDMINGCERVLRIFQKKVVTSSRKRKSLNFDLPNVTDMTTTEEDIKEKNDIEEVDFEKDCSLQTPPSPNILDKIIPNSPGKLSPEESATTPVKVTEDMKQNQIITIEKNGVLIKVKPCNVVLSTSEIVSHLQKDSTTTPKNATVNPFKLKSCSVVVVPCDAVQNPSTIQLCESPLPLSVMTIEDDENKNPLNETTPAEQILCTQQQLNSSLIDIITPSKLFTPSKRVTLFVDRIKKTGGCFKSILLFRKIGVRHLQEYFEEEPEFDQSKMEGIIQAFESALKEVFPFLDMDEFKQTTESTNIDSEYPSSIYFEPDTQENNKAKNKTPLSIGMGVVNNTDENPFNDNYWDEENCEDERQCSFCGEKGDFSPDSCGRLLWAGMNEWVHTNCTLWSSEVWEEENGALQQVGSALVRSKHTKCVYCEKKGASVSCCHSSCHDSYHFLCAINAKCSLLEDKTLFCPTHRKSAKGDIQQEMDVMRKVFVDPEWLKKKDCLSWSTEVRVCIGSLRIERLGYVAPISTMEVANQEDILVPLEFHCYRLYWSHVNPSAKVLYSFRTEIDQGGFVFPNMSCEGGCGDEGVNITVDHSCAPEIVRKKLNQVKEFHDWVDNSTRYLDEYNIEWIPSCPLDFTDTPDFTLEDVFGNMYSFESPESTLVSSMSLDNGSDTTISDYEDDTEDDLISVEKENLFELSSNVGLNEESRANCIVNVTPKKNTQVHSTLNVQNANSITKTCSGRVTRSSARTATDFIRIPQLDGAYDDDSSEPESMETEEESEDGNEDEGEDEDEEEEDEEEDESSEGNSESKDTSVTEEDTSEDEESLTDSYRKSIRTTRQTVSNSKALTQRTLRSRVKQPKLEVRKVIHKCPACKKPFQSKSSVSKHLRFCKAKKTRKVSISKEENDNKPTSSKSQKTSPRKLTRLRKSVAPRKDKRKSTSSSNANINKKSLRRKSSEKVTKRQQGTSKSTPSKVKEDEENRSSSSSDSEPQSKSQKMDVEKLKETPSSAPVDSSQQKQDSNDENDENKSSEDKILICTSQDDEKPVKCDNCHMTYRTAIGYEKHLAFCVAYSSTTEEDETDNSNGRVTPPEEQHTKTATAATNSVVQEMQSVPTSVEETQNVDSTAATEGNVVVSNESSDSVAPCEEEKLPSNAVLQNANISVTVDPEYDASKVAPENLTQEDEESYPDEIEQQLDKSEKKEEVVDEEEEMEEEDSEFVKENDTELIYNEPGDEVAQVNVNSDLIGNSHELSESSIPIAQQTNMVIEETHSESKLHSLSSRYQPQTQSLLPEVLSQSSSVMPVQSIQVPLATPTVTNPDLYNIRHQGSLSLETSIPPTPTSLPPPIQSQTYQQPDQLNVLNKEYNNTQPNFVFPQITNQTLTHSVPIAHPVPNTPATATYPTHQHHPQPHQPPQLQQQPEIFPVPSLYNINQNSPHERQQNLFVPAAQDKNPSVSSPQLQQQQNNYLVQSSSDLHSQQLLRDFAAIQQSISSNSVPNNVGRPEESPVLPASMDFQRRIHAQQQQHEHPHSISVVPQQIPQQQQQQPPAAPPTQYHTITIQDSSGQLMTIQVPIPNQHQPMQQSHQHVQPQATQQQSVQQPNNLNLQQLQFQLQQQQQQQQSLVLPQQQPQQLALQQQQPGQLTLQQQQPGHLTLQQQQPGHLTLQQQQQGHLTLQQQQQGHLTLQQQQQGHLTLQQQQHGQLVLQQQQQQQQAQLSMQQQQMTMQQAQQQQSLQLVLQQQNNVTLSPSHLQQQLALQQAQQQTQQLAAQQQQQMNSPQQYGGIPQYRQDMFSQLQSNPQQVHVEQQQQRYPATTGGGQLPNNQLQQHPSIGFQQTSPQQAQTITDASGTTYYIVQQGNSISTIPLNQGQLSQVISQMPQQQLQGQQQQQQISGGLITAGQVESHQQNFPTAHNTNQFHHNPNCPAAGRGVPEILQCIANVVQPDNTNATPQQQMTEHYNAGSSNMTVNSPGSAHPCPCPRCLTRAHGLLGEEKLAVIPKFPQPKYGTKPWATIAKRSPGKNNKGNLLEKKRPLGMNYPKLLPATVVNTGTVASSSCMVTSGMNTTTESILCQALGKGPVSSPNIAVVRPMEHPLQRMADQVSQMENSFHTSTSASLNTTALVNNQQASQMVAVNENISAVQNSQGLNSAQQSQGRNIVVRRHEANTSAAVKANNSKPIKMVLQRKELGDSYCIKEVKGGNSASDGGPFRNLKIKGRITTGLQSGKLSDVVVTPKVSFVPTPDPDCEDESNLTVAEEQSISDVVSATASSSASSSNVAIPEGQANKSGMRFTRRAVVVYEVTCTDTSHVYRSSDVRAVWSHIFEVVQGRRQNYNLPPLSYPEQRVTLSDFVSPKPILRDKRGRLRLIFINISQRNNIDKQGEPEGFNKWGLTHRAVQFLLEQLPGNKSVNHQFQFHNPPTSGEDSPVPLNESGCARTEPYAGRKPFDMFGWLASKHRQPPSTFQNLEASKGQGLPLAMRFRNLREKSKSILTVYWSAIHGRGLYTRRDIEKGEMIIEYAGEVVRSLVCEEREKYYESKGMGCYQFRIDQHYVVDATMKGNAARFINHSCEPNCESKTIKILGNMHILIFALRRINAGEELTYDYKFPYEDEDKKIACTCASKKCRKYLN